MNGNDLFTPSQKVEELLRSKLGISDIRDPKVVLPALQKLYPQELQRLKQETTGLPVVTAEAPVAVTTKGDTVGSLYVADVRSDLEADFRIVCEAPAARTWRQEHLRWKAEVVAELESASKAAAQATDGICRDRAVLGVLRLQEQAFLARLLGHCTLQIKGDYRRLARTLDAAVMGLRVMIGEQLTLSRAGQPGFRPAATSLLHQHRDAVLRALRAMLGAQNSSPAMDDDTLNVPQTLHVVRESVETLGKDGSGLAVLLSAEYLEECLNRIIDSTTSPPSAQAGKAVGSVGPQGSMDLLRLNRLWRLLDAQWIQGKGRGNIPPTLQVFIEAVASFTAACSLERRGYRYQHIAMARALEDRQPDEGTERLDRLMQLRRRLLARAELVARDDGNYHESLLMSRALLALDVATEAYANGTATIKKTNYDSLVTFETEAKKGLKLFEDSAVAELGWTPGQHFYEPPVDWRDADLKAATREPEYWALQQPGDWSSEVRARSCLPFIALPGDLLKEEDEEANGQEVRLLREVVEALVLRWQQIMDVDAQKERDRLAGLYANCQSDFMQRVQELKSRCERMSAFQW